MTVRETAIALMWALGAGGLAWYAGRALSQITYVTLADGRRQERRLPVAFRLLLPLAPNFLRFFNKPGFEKWRATLHRKLVSAGFEGVVDAAEFLAIRAALLLVGGPLLLLGLRLFLVALPGVIGQRLLDRQVLFYLAALVLLHVYPSLWLKRAVSVRARSIERSLPFVLDLMTLSVEAGLDFMSSMRRITERRKVDALGEELIRTFREIQLGKTRREALRTLADRCGQEDIRTLVAALVQADELGVSIGSILRIQADQMRQRRFQRAEKMAQQAPVKMLFPLVAFIFPCVFIILLGPIFMQLLRHGF